MAEIVKMPKLSDTMTEGVVAKWHKKVGDPVKSGELLADIETDKATMEFESFQDGVLLHIGVQEGKAAPVDSILAVLGKAGEDISALLAAETTKAAPIIESTPTPAKEVAAPSAAIPVVTSPSPFTKAETIQVSSATNDRLKASPLAKLLAQEKGVDVNKIKGSGDGGRVIKRDIENYQGGSRSIVREERYTEVSVSQMRKTIAKRLAESKFSAPHFYLTVSIDMEAAMQARTAINEVSPVKISFNDLIIKASALSLKKHPAVNSAWLGDKIRYNEHTHIGVAVAVEDGLLVPVVRFADSKPLSEIAAEVKDLGKRAKEKKLQPADWQGNTFTISNLGMFGIEEFTAIINPPDACILAVGGISDVPVVKNGQVVPGHVMKLTLSCDHRVVDGASGASFLQTLKKYLENPVLLVGEGNI
jgi:pyruvate dehydrogenase E2 component (dihydrolipoamide acetyltransferase)